MTRFEEEEKRIRREEASEDKKMKAKGFRYKLVAWVHPETGGDDYPIAAYCVVKPTVKEIKKLLTKKGSCHDSDYTIKTL